MLPLLLATTALATASQPRIISGLASIADNYDAIFLDQFGVMHDGQKPLPGAIDCFPALAAAGKKLVVLSNTSRRRAFAIQKLPKLGFDDDKLTGFVTSGEAAWDYMAANFGGKRVLWISRGTTSSTRGTRATSTALT